MIFLDCYTDASVDCNHKLVSVAFVISDKLSTIVHQSSHTYTGTCNNNGEMVAILEAIEWLSDYLKDKDHSSYSLYIKTDSKNSIDSILHSRHLRQLYLQLKSKVAHISIVHVRRSKVQLAHNLARKTLKQAIHVQPTDQKQIQRKLDKQIERAYILSQWLKQTEG